MVNVPFLLAQRMYVKVMDDELDVCPLTIWKLDCEEVEGPISTSKASGMSPALKPLAS